LLHGETLRETLSAGALPIRKAVDVAVQVCRGLAAAHEREIVHRDLKPENIFVLPDGQVKILDFGLARQVITPTSVMGTVGYMAPEQVRGFPADARADLFALGAVLCEMLSGKRAFSAETATDTMFAVVKDEPPDLSSLRPDVHQPLLQIVGHCLEKNPAGRFQSARDVAFALEALSGSSASSRSAFVDVPVVTSRRLPLFAVLAIVILASISAAFLVGPAFGSRFCSRVHQL